MKIVVNLTDVNQYKICPVCKRIFPREDNFCPYEENMVELLEIEVQP